MAEKTEFNNKLKDLLNIQLEVTERLLESEEHKLKLLKTEIDIARHKNKDDTQSKDKQLEMQEKTLFRIRSQYQRLSQEMQSMGEMHKKRIKASRSLPAIGMKQTSKRRPSLFDHYVPVNELMSAKMEEVERLQSKDPTPSPIELQTGLFTPQQLSEELEYKEGVLVAGSLSGLIQLLLPLDNYYPDVTFMFAFLLCSRLFISPHSLLSRVSRIMQSIYRQNPEMDQKDPQKYLQLIREWIEKFPYDFRDENMMRELKRFTQFCGSISPQLRKEVGQIQSMLIQRLSTLDKYQHVLSQVNTISVEKMIDPKTQVDILKNCSSPVVLAQQLTHIELERLNNIGAEEFVQTFIKSPAESNFVKTTSNIEAYVEWFNRLSYLVATEICISDKNRDRVRLMDFFLDAAMECRNLNNFNSFMAIAAGLYMSPVVRLKKVRSKLNKRKFDDMENFLDPSSNFAVYRQALASATDKARTNKTCVVPLFSLVIKDLYFENQAGPNKLPNGWIRFEKCLALARLVSQTFTWKDTVLSFQRKGLLLNYLMTAPIHTDDELMLVSYEIEPPESSREKTHYQQLKGLHGSYARCIGKQGGSVSGGVSIPNHPMFKK